MPSRGRPSKPEPVEEGLKDMKIRSRDSSDEEAWGTIAVGEIRQGKEESKTSSPSPAGTDIRSASQSPRKRDPGVQTPDTVKEEPEETLGGEILVKIEPEQPPKMARSSTQKVIAKAPQLFLDYDDKTDEATSIFDVITTCTYSNKYLGSTEHAMECDCNEEWDATTRTNLACGEDSDCINRATKMECSGDCGCGTDCQNQRFQRHEYAKVTVVKTEKKGYGLRANTDLHPNDFIFEYIGEVINEGQFRKRMIQYDEEGIRHFYFMSLNKGEFVDATKKGNLGRFCNHSCNPNCYVDKWVVGEKLRMGIFAERKIRAGEELVFNYNVDRYGADPQPCYCGEPNCTGFIGGKTQTERATKLSNATIEALGIEDGDSWDTAVAKKPRKRKTGEDDEEYVNAVQPKLLDEDGVTKVMATLMQCKEKWIAVKLLGRIQCCDDERVINRVVKMHGYQILNSALTQWNEDFNVVLQILEILHSFPRLTKNKISDSKIEDTVTSLSECGDERVESQAALLLKEWSTLETAYRIPRKKRDPNASAEAHSHFERRDSARDERRRRSKSRSRSRSPSIDAPRGPAAPTGPRSNIPQRSAVFRPQFRPPRAFNSGGVLPPGWFAATSEGKTYYYSSTGQTTWVRPTAPSTQPPPPPKPVSATKALDDIINSITSQTAKTSAKASAVATPTDDPKVDKKEGKEKWRSYNEEKKMKLYENTLYPHIKQVVDKYKHKLPKDDVKRFFKEICKKLVSSDFKNKRVDDPTKISPKQEKNIKKYTKEYFDKAVAKKMEHNKKKAEKQDKGEGPPQSPVNASNTDGMRKEEESDGDGVMEMSEDDDVKRGEPNSITPITPLDHITNGEGLKRKREAETGENSIRVEDVEGTPNKRARSITPPLLAPPPPPPPPPAEGMSEDEPMVDGAVKFEDEFTGDERVKMEGAEYDPAGGSLATNSKAYSATSGGVVGKRVNIKPEPGCDNLHPNRMSYVEA